MSETYNGEPGQDDDKYISTEIDNAYLVRRIEGLEERIKIIETSLAYFLFDQEQMEQLLPFRVDCGTDIKNGNT